MNPRFTWKCMAAACLSLVVATAGASAADEGRAPEGMALIPAGSFEMGDTFNETGSNAQPVHAVSVSAFYIEKYEVTKVLWDSVCHWATNNGYKFDDPGYAKGSNHPVLGVRWFSAVKWCNARSEKEGLAPCYYTATNQTTATVFRTYTVNVSNSWVNWSANGYRLPTEAEWEKAARGGKPGHRFSWSDTDTISHSNANYWASKGTTAFDANTYADWLAGQSKYHPAYEVDKPPFTSPVGSFAPNGYGLYDTTGNAYEHCWDLYDVNWYKNAGATQSDTRGPDVGVPFALGRVFRGGSWNVQPGQQQVGLRSVLMPWFGKDYLTFRCVRGQ